MSHPFQNLFANVVETPQEISATIQISTQEFEDVPAEIVIEENSTYEELTPFPGKHEFENLFDHQEWEESEKTEETPNFNKDEQTSISTYTPPSLKDKQEDPFQENSVNSADITPIPSTTPENHFENELKTNFQEFEEENKNTETELNTNDFEEKNFSDFVFEPEIYKELYKEEPILDSKFEEVTINQNKSEKEKLVDNAPITEPVFTEMPQKTNDSPKVLTQTQNKTLPSTEKDRAAVILSGMLANPANTNIDPKTLIDHLTKILREFEHL